MMYCVGAAHVHGASLCLFRSQDISAHTHRVSRPSVCFNDASWLRDTKISTPVSRCNATPVPGGPPSEPGDANVQDALARMMQVNVKSKMYQAEVDKEAERQRELLIQKAEEVKQEIDRTLELNKARSDLAFGSAMADIEEKYREFEEQLRESRKRMEQDELDFDAFREKVANDRNAGLFYKNLYVDEELEADKRKKRKAHGTLQDMTRQELQEAAQATQKDVRTPTPALFLLTITFIVNSALLVDALQGNANWTSIAAATVTFSLGLSLTFIERQRDIVQLSQDPDKLPSSDTSSRPK